jgi:hypothetical protein
MRVYKFLNAEFGMKSLREKRLKISIFDDLNDPFDLLPYKMTKNRLNFISLITHIADTFGIVCFSSSWRDPVIWAHYSDKHKGLCLGFEIPERLGQKVRYVKRRLPLPRHRVLNESLLFTKYVNWSYEKEVRCFRPFLQSTKSGNLYFMEFGEELKLVEVIVGARCEIAETDIRCAIEPLKDIELIKARAGFKRFEVVEDHRGFPSPSRT